MSTLENNSSIFDVLPEGFGEELEIGIVVAHWNKQVTELLLEGAKETLKKYGATYKILRVPGAFELPYGASFLLDQEDLNAIIVLGCVIQGETRHFDFVCQGVTTGITNLNIDSEVPIIFGVLTTENLEQALDRAGGKLGNKGVECAIAAMQMAQLEIE